MVKFQNMTKQRLMHKIIFLSKFYFLSIIFIKMRAHLTLCVDITYYTYSVDPYLLKFPRDYKFCSLTCNKTSSNPKGETFRWNIFKGVDPSKESVDHSQALNTLNRDTFWRDRSAGRERRNKEVTGVGGT